MPRTTQGVVKRLGLIARREQVQAERVRVGGEEYRAGLVGTLGVQIFPLTFVPSKMHYPRQDFQKIWPCSLTECTIDLRDSDKDIF